MIFFLIVDYFTSVLTVLQILLHIYMFNKHASVFKNVYVLDFTFLTAALDKQKKLCY